MMNDYWWNNAGYMPWFGNGPHLVGVGFFAVGVVLVWTLVWKALALWAAARDGSRVWFIVILLLNTVGILDILYLYVLRKKTAEAVHDAK